MKNDHLSTLQTATALRMMSELITSNPPVFKRSNVFPTGVLMNRKKGGGAGTHFKNEPDNRAISFFLKRSEKLDPEQDASSDSNIHSRTEIRKKSQR